MATKLARQDHRRRLPREREGMSSPRRPIRGHARARSDNFAQIQTLEMGPQEKATDAGLAHLKRLTKLLELPLSGCRRSTDAGMVFI